MEPNPDFTPVSDGAFTGLPRPETTKQTGILVGPLGEMTPVDHLSGPVRSRLVWLRSPQRQVILDAPQLSTLMKRRIAARRQRQALTCPAPVITERTDEDDLEESQPPLGGNSASSTHTTQGGGPLTVVCLRQARDRLRIRTTGGALHPVSPSPNSPVGPHRYLNFPSLDNRQTDVLPQSPQRPFPTAAADAQGEGEMWHSGGGMKARYPVGDLGESRRSTGTTIEPPIVSSLRGGKAAGCSCFLLEKGHCWAGEEGEGLSLRCGGSPTVASSVRGSQSSYTNTGDDPIPPFHPWGVDAGLLPSLPQRSSLLGAVEEGEVEVSSDEVKGDRASICGKPSLVSSPSFSSSSSSSSSSVCGQSRLQRDADKNRNTEEGNYRLPLSVSIPHPTAAESKKETRPHEAWDCTREGETEREKEGNFRGAQERGGVDGAGPNTRRCQ
uniref:Uncharacterized protein n=1 Tax=Chromera velia CCMP2878 TaxID=1169474 RepID=A0A0G4I930_9ALVE|eukprot:Cvel_2019.t1-p1 / transcript=Cvel_2019.t1 / gene=Cvel_2019 / organism=Chromera_velia_CCMP2878 / gene_product=hypothetical protein / transcript_product=hypothetical protein / location=Cvel_scaffold77:100393-101709(+) / protein_length=439 / sequence_SO=supercontig / SO=protein_coding / is_pseudo=false